MGTFRVRDAVEADLPAITELANALLATTAIEWTDVPHTVDGRRAWMAHLRDAGHPVLVAEQDGDVVGWAAYGPFRDVGKWPGYRFTVEHTIHVRGDRWGAGVGRALVDELVARARAAGMHAMVAAVDGDNEASVEFHRRLGFVEAGRLPHVGTKLGRWLDLVLLVLVLDDRPPPPS